MKSPIFPLTAFFKMLLVSYHSDSLGGEADRVFQGNVTFSSTFLLPSFLWNFSMRSVLGSSDNFQWFVTESFRLLNRSTACPQFVIYLTKCESWGSWRFPKILFWKEVYCSLQEYCTAGKVIQTFSSEHAIFCKTSLEISALLDRVSEMHFNIE